MNLFRSLLYKEWIKTRVTTVVLFLAALLFLLYTLYNFHRALRIQDVAHLWSVMLERDAIFVDRLRYIPMILGFVLATAQMIPEVLQKRLKLTLHLPLSDIRSTYYMLAYGASFIFSFVLLLFLGSAISYGMYLPSELLGRILYSLIPWCMGGFSSYFLTSWIILEGNMRMRAIALLISVGLQSLFFLDTAPEAYTIGMLVVLSSILLFTALLPLYAVYRFRRGYVY